MISTPSRIGCHPAIFDLTDPAERFTVEFMQRFHASQRGRYRVLAMRRTEIVEGGKRHRLVVQATRFQPQRRGARPEWEVLIWDIDGPGVRFIKRRSRAAMLDLYRSIGVNPGANVDANLSARPSIKVDG